MNQQFVLCIASWLFTIIAWSEAFVPAVLDYSRHTGSSPTRTTPTARVSRWLAPSSSEDSVFDMKELQHRINQEYSAAVYLPIEVGGLSTMEKPEMVYVVVFQPGTCNQGAHTIEYPQGSGNNVVLAFESFPACRKFAESLAEQNFVDPQPLEFYMSDLESYFEQLGVAVQVVPEGVQLKPPTKNVKRFGHDPSLRDTKKHLDYIFAMTDEDLDEIGLLETTVSTNTITDDADDDAWQ